MTTKAKALLLASSFLVVPRASFADVKAECVAASTQGQTLRDEGKLRKAHERLLACAKDECPSIVRNACVEWLLDVDKRQPSIVVRAADGDGKDLTDVRVRIDGVVVEERNEGKPIAVDPGEHLVRYERANGEVVEQKVVVVEGDKGRMLTVRIGVPARAPEAPIEAPGRPIPALTFIFGGAGLVGLASFAYFGYAAKQDLDHLRVTCEPRCSSSDVSSVKTQAMVADVSLGAGVVLIAVAVGVFLMRPEAPPPTTVGVWPIRGGGAAGFATTF